MAIRNFREMLNGKHKRKKISSEPSQIPKKSNIASFPTAGNQGLWW
jgi:hypothetical protein